MNDGEREDQKSIEDLPVEMLEEVFLALDAKSLKNCCLVNKKWNKIIGQSSRIMKKLPLLLDSNCISSWSDVYQESKNFEHKFHTIRIKDHIESDEYAIKTLRKFGAECRRIKFFRCYEFSIGSVKFPLLESAKILCAENMNAIGEIMKALSSSQLKHFSYTGYSGSEVMTFLSTQTKLTKLKLTSFNHNFSLKCLSDIERIQIPLKTLSLSVKNAMENQEMLVAFLSRFTETLEDLTFDFYKKSCDSVFELIFSKFNKLKNLTIYIDRVPQENSFYHKLRPNYSVKKLQVRGWYRFIENPEILETFVKLLPNVETLESHISGIPYDFLLFVCNHLKNLNALYIIRNDSLGLGVDPFSLDKFPRVRLPNVKTFDFLHTVSVEPEQWKVFVDALPNVESFSFRFWRLLDHAELRNCESLNTIGKIWPNLISLKITDGFIAHDEIFFEHLCKSKSIKKVELSENAFFKLQKSKAEILERVKKHGLRLIIYKSNQKIDN